MKSSRVSSRILRFVTILLLCHVHLEVFSAPQVSSTRSASQATFEAEVRTVSAILRELEANLEETFRILRNNQTDESVDRVIKPAVPNGGGCANCDTVASINPAQGLLTSVTTMINALNAYLRRVFTRG
jgi:hypothetical protein